MNDMENEFLEESAAVGGVEPVVKGTINPETSDADKKSELAVLKDRNLTPAKKLEGMLTWMVHLRLLAYCFPAVVRNMSADEILKEDTPGPHASDAQR
jgi:hypothetical protein